MLRIIEAAKAQVKEDDACVKKTVGDGLTRGSLCAVLFDNDDGTASCDGMVCAWGPGSRSG